MTPVKEKAPRGRSITGDPGLGTPHSQEEPPGDGREHEGRRAGIILVALGCLLMALAAGEAAVDTSAAHDTFARTLTILVP